MQSNTGVLRAIRRASIDGSRARAELVLGLQDTFATELANSEVWVYALLNLLGHESWRHRRGNNTFRVEPPDGRRFVGIGITGERGAHRFRRDSAQRHVRDRLSVVPKRSLNGAAAYRPGGRMMAHGDTVKLVF